MKTETIQKICMALAIAFIVAMVYSSLSRFFPRTPSAIKFLSPGLAVTTFAYSTLGLITLSVQVGIAIWLFRRNHENHRWLWFLLGVVLGVMALIVNLLIEISAKLDRQELNQDTQQNPGA